jgi:hypothetical protein
MKVRTRNVTSAEAKKVERMVRRCIRHLRKKEYELNLPQCAADDAIRCLEVKKIAGTPSRAGAYLIRINLGYWQFGNSYHTEYKAYNADPTIGAIQVEDDDDHLMIMVAHEVAHHIQYRYGHRINRFRYNYRKPHGDCFRQIYRYLRKDLVNPGIKKKLSVDICSESV